MTPSKAQLVAATTATGGLLAAIAIWTQARLGASLLPHSFCITASPALLWLHQVSDALIAFAYLVIPWAMVNVVRKRKDIPFGWMAWLFGAFIVACGLSHAMEVWTLWYPVYWYSGVVKAFTAAASLATAWTLYILTPHVLRLPSAGQLRDANEALEQEIASRRSAEAELRRAKAELEAVLGKTTAHAQQIGAVLDRFFEAAPLGLVLLDQDMKVLRINPALPRATHRDPQEYVGRRFEELPRMPAEAVAAVRDVIATREPRHNAEFSRIAPDGGEVHMSATYFPIELPSGETLLGGVVQDVTQHRAAEQQRHQALAAARDANLAKDQFLAKVSHELRSPLQVALSCAEVLKRVPDLPPAARKFVDRLAHAISMQARMINDLLDVSRILSGKLHVENETVDPALPLLRVIDHWRTAAQGRSIRLDAAGIEAGGAIVQADPARLEQVYANLVDNAIRFSDDGGEVQLTAFTSGSHWRFIVRDFGAGLTEKDLQRVFEPFAQGVTQPRAGKGLGLGLAIVRSLVEAFGGRVWAESAGPGRGSTFVVELPLAPEDSAPPSIFGEERAAPRLDGLAVLYVEDDREVALGMQESLARLGAGVEIAMSYEEAVAKLRSLRLDVVVTDLNLGGASGGKEVAGALHGMSRHALVPVIAVSAYGTPEDHASTRRAGFAEHLVKPVDAATVAFAIRRALG